MTDDAYPPPTDATVKRLYGSAFRCAHPDCTKPLYKTSDDTGDRILNSRVAHIHARRHDGPRWIEMPAEDNRGFDNLLLLCIDHSYEIDEFPDNFPAETLRDWKAAQLDEYDQLQRNWPISDEEAAEVLAESETLDTLHAPSTVELVRRIEALKLVAQRTRAGVRTWARSWQQLRKQTQGGIRAWGDDGKLLPVEPSAAQVRPLQEGIVAALDAAITEATPAAEAARIELAAARATRPAVSPWCDALDRAITKVTDTAAVWSGGSDPAKDAEFDDAISAMAAALSELLAASRGETVPLPVLPAEPSEPAGVNPYAVHAELLEEARPFARVDHLAYDPELRQRVAAATQCAVAIPPTPTLLHLSLATTAALAVDIAKNATHDDKLELLEGDHHRTPICAAASLLQAATRDADQSGDTVLADAGRQKLRQLFTDTDWASEDGWRGNDVHGQAMMYAFARVTSDDEVRDRLSAALTDNPGLRDTIVVACAGWQEHRDSRSFEVIGFGRSYREIPGWFPVGTIVLAAEGILDATGRAPEELIDTILQHAQEATEG